MLKWLKKLLRRNNSDFIENELTEEAIRDNEEADREARERVEGEVPASVIYYTPPQDEKSGPGIQILVEEFTGPILPEKDSIVWIRENDTTLRPFKCIRYDFFESGNEAESMRVYIVVEAAKNSEIIPHPKFQYENKQ